MFFQDNKLSEILTAKQSLQVQFDALQKSLEKKETSDKDNVLRIERLKKELQEQKDSLKGLKTELDTVKRKNQESEVQQ